MVYFLFDLRAVSDGNPLEIGEVYKQKIVNLNFVVPGGTCDD